MSISKEVLEKYGLPTLEHFRENMLEYETEAMYYQSILDVTDHVPLKIFESFIENMATASLAETIGVVIGFFKDVKITYNDVLAARKTAREELNKIEAEAAE